MSPVDVLLSVLGCLFTAAFALWARRLDRALDLLEKIQQSTNDLALKTETRLTALETIIGYQRSEMNANKRTASETMGIRG